MNESDRRVHRTRGLLVHALLELTGTRRYEQISVQDLVERAGVGRSTFYAHFRNKDALLMGGFEHMLETLVQHIQCDSDGRLCFDTAMLFEHARGHYEIYRNLRWGGGFEMLIRDGHAALSEKVEARLKELGFATDECLVPVPVLALSLAVSLLTLLKWWLENKMPFPAERMDTIFQHMVMTGVHRVGHLPILENP